MNIYDIAAKCGVSIATVSRVLNNNPNVSNRTREKVLAVMQEENYTPSSMARGLGTGYTRMVGLVCAAPHSPLSAEAIGYIEGALHAEGMTTLLRTIGTQAEDVKQELDELAQQGVDAILLVGSVPGTEENTACLEAAACRAPLVLVGSYLPLTGAYSVTCDEKKAVTELIAALFGRQRRNVLLLHSGDTYADREKIAGYREGYTAAGYTADDQRIIPVEPSLDAVNACIKQLLVKGVSFDAVIGTEDILALGAQKALQRIGLTMPVIGCGNSLLARCSTPELTSIDTHPEALCRTAVEVLCHRLRGEEVAAHTVLSADLMERDTFRRN
ncbi:MAG: LacI family DNA-binding transcriptional regulator [Clostridia bacterium]|nr:LacI family DNA-binding transcriptional regulator [Clostridia bacterium]